MVASNDVNGVVNNMWNPFKKSSWQKVKLALAFGEAAQANNLKPEHVHKAVKYYYDKWYNDEGKIPNKLDK